MNYLISDHPIFDYDTILGRNHTAEQEELVDRYAQMKPEYEMGVLYEHETA